MNIRLLKLSDAAQYWDLRLEMLKQNPEAFATSYEQALQRKNPHEQVKQNFSTEGSYTFGAFNNENELVGAVTLLQEKHVKFKHKANILAMYVRPEMRSSGIGGKLLDQAIQKAKSLDEIEQLKLMVVASNKKAKNLYVSFGFEIYGTERNALKIEETYYDEHHMVLFIR